MNLAQYLRQFPEYRHDHDNRGIDQAKQLELVSRIKANDQSAKAEFINANIGLVVSLARKYAARDENILLDLVHDGIIALLRLPEHYDATKGSVVTLAFRYIQTEILEKLRDTYSLVRYPSNHHGAKREIDSAVSNISQKNSSEPSDAEILKYKGHILNKKYGRKHTENDIATLRNISIYNNSLSLNVSLRGKNGYDHDSSDMTWQDRLQSDSSDVDKLLLQDELSGILKEHISTLPRLQRRVIEDYYYKGKRSDEIGTDLGKDTHDIQQNLFLARKRLKIAIESNETEHEKALELVNS